jgi:hypothetical protein
MRPVGFEPTISVLERAKTVRALDLAATAIDISDMKKNFNHVSAMFKGRELGTSVRLKYNCKIYM